MQNIKIIETEDGSHSLYLPELKETYHSFHGAIQESIYVYITQGFNILAGNSGVKELKILEIGFGTGLNVLLTLAEAQQSKIKINLTTIEPCPLPFEITNNLNYHELLSSNYPLLNLKSYYISLHSTLWNKPVKITDRFILQKKLTKVQEISEAEGNYDLVYFDAFAPSKQPEMWQVAIFDKLYRMMKTGGIFVTYCAQGQFKRNLKASGFEVETLKGPPGKKEMVRAKKV